MVSSPAEPVRRPPVADAARFGQDNGTPLAPDGPDRASPVDQHTLLDAFPNLVWTARPDGTPVYRNQRWAQFTGLAKTGLDFEACVGIVHPHERPKIVAGWQQAVRTGQPFNEKCRLRSVSGSYQWMVGKAVPVHDTAGTVLQWLGTWTEIPRGVWRLRRSADGLDPRAGPAAARRSRHQDAPPGAPSLLTDVIVRNLAAELLGVMDRIRLVERRARGTPARDAARQGMRAVQRASIISSWLLPPAATRPADPPVMLQSVLARLAPLLRRVLGLSSRLAIECPAKLRSVAVDEAGLLSALLDIVLHAHLASPDRDTLLVDIRRCGRTEPGRPRELEAKPALAIAVTTGAHAPDDARPGPGPEPGFVPPAEAVCIIAHEFARQSGGALRVGGATMAGSTTTLFLPAPPPARQALRSAPVDADPAAAARRPAGDAGAATSVDPFVTRLMIRIRSRSLQTLLRRWHLARGSSAIPAIADFDVVDASRAAGLWVIDVDPNRLPVLFTIGSRHPASPDDAGEGPFADIDPLHHPAMRSGRPHYASARLERPDGRPVLAERLVLPFGNGGPEVAGLVVAATIDPPRDPATP